ncbi:MAG: FGGY family carbohydrate kinase [Solirubrobacteraceae bacterium]
MNGDDVWVGFDVGTQGARAVAVSGDGRVVGRGEAALRGRREAGRHEQDPAAWWEATALASRAAMAGVAPERVRGVATCATSGTVLLVDREGEQLTPGLMYDDARAAEQAARVGMPASWGLPKLAWMLDAWPDLARGARAAHQADVITRRLAGHDVPADSSHALKTGYDVERERWPALDLPDGMLPDVVRSGTLLGEVCAAAAAETGLPPGTPVVAGMTDGCASQLAAGAVREGSWVSVLGTTLVLKGCSTRLLRDPAGVLYSHRSPGGAWLPGGASSTGAGVLAATFLGRDLDELGARAAEHERTSVLAYPLVSRGERFPFAAPEAEAFMLGEPSGDAERFAALLQGVAFVERLCFDAVDLLGAAEVRELTLTGGGTRSRYWCQLRADVLGHPVRLVEHPDAAFGMAVLAASSGGDVAATAAEMVLTREVIEPRGSHAGRFEAPYLRLVSELERRGWLGAPLAEHARHRCCRG